MKLWPFGFPSRRPKARASPRILRARYDAARTTPENRSHWLQADSYSADAANSPDVRKKLRERARYEVANNSYAKGIILTLANDCIGTGPRLQVLSEDGAMNRRIETEFARWAKAVHLPEQLRTMRMAKATDGESFAVLHSNPSIDSPVQLDLHLVETERVTTPTRELLTQSHEIDGIVLDANGDPVAYTILNQHPGDCHCFDTAVSRYPAEHVIHYFRSDRPGQHRGVPEITPALELFGQLRRYTLAVLAAAETAADFAAVLYTDAPANGESAAVEPMDLVALEKRMATTLPDGWKLGQLKAEQPCTGYGEFKREILNEIARCLNIPYNIAACNSSGYNYASGRLDHQTYFKSIRVEQAHLAERVLDRIFAAWLQEARILGLVSPEVSLSHQWFFDGSEHVDPVKEATAQKTRLANHTTTLAVEYARQGRDWETELRQRAKEQQLINELGLSSQESPVATPKESKPHESQLTP